jgi:hypothetical protein
VWSPLPLELSAALPKIERSLALWERTKYRSGQRLRGVEADCIGFGCGHVDDVDGRPRAQAPSLPADTALHNPTKAKEAVMEIRRLYEPCFRVLPFEGVLYAQPLDILIVASGAGGPGHMMTVGPQPNTLWHCTAGPGVNRSGWSLFSGYERVFGLYRIGDRERWVA